jgi:predicted DNA-binding transcriptional regulator YafY
MARRVRSKLLTLGIEIDQDLLRSTPRPVLEGPPAMTPLAEASAEAKATRFDYRGADGHLATRHVEPWLVGVNAGHWYLVGYDLDRDAQRVFRLSRIESFPKVSGEATRDRPAEIDLPSLVAGAQAGGDDVADVDLRIAPYKALDVRDRLGSELDGEQVRSPGADRASTRRTVLAGARWITLESPAAWRREIAEIMEGIEALHTGDADLAATTAGTVRQGARVRSASSGADRLSGLIALAAYVQERGEVEIEELQGEFGLAPDRLVKDLETLFVCGDHGTGWEQDLIEAEWDGGVVRVRNADTLHRALRLTDAEATALLAGLEALDPGTQQVRSVVDSARRALREHLGTTQQGIGQAAPTTTGTMPTTTGPEEDRRSRIVSAILAAIRTGSPLRIRYSPPDRAGTSVRTIHPHELVSDGGRTTAHARCDLVGAERRFRVDRIVEVEPAEPDDTPENDGRTGTRTGIVEGEAWLRLRAPAAWVIEAFGAREIHDLDEGTTVIRLQDPVRSAVVDAVFEAAGALEVLAPSDLRAEVHALAGRSAADHTATRR